MIEEKPGLCKRCGLPVIWSNGYFVHRKSKDTACTLHAEPVIMDGSIELTDEDYDDCDRKSPCKVIMKIIQGKRISDVDIDCSKYPCKIINKLLGEKNDRC